MQLQLKYGYNILHMRYYIHILRKKYHSTKFGKKVANSKLRAWIYKTFYKDVHTKTLAAIFIIAGITAIACEIDWIVPEKVTVDYVTFSEKQTKQSFVRTDSVGEAARLAGFDVKNDDYFFPIKEKEVKQNMKIEVRESVETTAEIFGKTQDFKLIPGTVEANLKFNGIKPDEDDSISPALDKEVTSKTKIVVKTIDKDVVEKREVEKAKHLVILDPTLSSGIEQKVTGHDGEGIFLYTTTYVNGKKSGTERTVKKWITKPVNHTIKLGSSETGHSGTYEITKTFTANTTAYWMSGNPHGASGGACVYGTAAVDPSVFPYGTLLWVEGYGPAVANDCGSAVKGNIVDLWMRSYNESLQWGRRFVKSYVLKKVG